MALRNEIEASKEFVFSHFCEDYLGVTKDNYEDHYVTVQVILNDLNQNIIVSLLQGNDEDINNATPVEDRQNEDPIILTLGDGQFTIISNTAYSKYFFVKIDPNGNTTGRATVKILI